MACRAMQLRFHRVETLLNNIFLQMHKSAFNSFIRYFFSILMNSWMICFLMMHLQRLFYPALLFLYLHQSASTLWGKCYTVFDPIRRKVWEDRSNVSVISTCFIAQRQIPAKSSPGQIFQIACLFISAKGGWLRGYAELSWALAWENDTNP